MHRRKPIARHLKLTSSSETAIRFVKNNTPDSDSVNAVDTEGQGEPGAAVAILNFGEENNFLECSAEDGDTRSLSLNNCLDFPLNGENEDEKFELNLVKTEEYVDSGTQQTETFDDCEYTSADESLVSREVNLSSNSISQSTIKSLFQNAMFNIYGKVRGFFTGSKPSEYDARISLDSEEEIQTTAVLKKKKLVKKRKKRIQSEVPEESIFRQHFTKSWISAATEVNWWKEDIHEEIKRPRQKDTTNYNVVELDMSKYLRLRTFSDVRLLVDELIFRADSFILKGQSTKFRQLLWNYNEYIPTIPINDLNKLELEALLIYMYTGRIVESFVEDDGYPSTRFLFMLDNYGIPCSTKWEIIDSEE